MKKNQIKIILNAKQFIRENQDAFIDHLFCQHPTIACKLIENFEETQRAMNPNIKIEFHGVTYDIPRNCDDAIRGFVKNSLKVEAIKELRNATGMGLKDAKDAIEAGMFGFCPRY